MDRGPYQNSPLLNEIHTYFPALLYNNDRFQTMSDVFAYIRLQMHNRFDTYSINVERANYMREDVPRRQSRQSRQSRQPVQPRQPIQPVQPRQPVQQRERYNTSSWNYTPVNTTNTAEYNDNLNRLLLLFGFPGSFTDPVYLVPSSEQISQGSTVYAITPEHETLQCSICQDSLRINEVARHLNYCNHVFHRGCIDTWYQRNVNCPVCRHDIRTR
jgi:hypothetical protein